MGRDTGPKCRKCRREGEKLFLKGERCYTRKCPMSGRSSPPGEWPKRRRPRKSQYQIHLRAKQKAKRIYGLKERQFRNCVEQAKKRKGVTGETLLNLLERRLDNAVYRVGFASSRAQARQIVAHGHLQVNGRPIDVASATLGEGDVVAVKEAHRERMKSLLETNKDRETPAWLEKDLEGMSFEVVTQPDVEQIGQSIAANLIVEFYSR